MVRILSVLKENEVTFSIKPEDILINCFDRETESFEIKLSPVYNTYMDSYYEQLNVVPFYMAPEVFDEQFDQSSIIYNLGAIIVHLTTKTPPFFQVDTTLIKTIQKIIRFDG